jgi:limonene-1,2-epoxide hydrolase
MRRGNVDRRRFLSIASVGASMFGLSGWTVTAAEMTDEEKTNIKVLEGFLTARWTVPFNAEKIGEFLTEDCIRGADDIRLHGRKAILDELTANYKDTTSADFKILQTWARGPLLMNERIEHTAIKGRSGGSGEWHGLGFFHLRDGKIMEWRTFTFRPAGAGRGRGRG